VSPLQVAVQTANLAMINKLISLDASLDHLDFEGNNVFHYAANTTKEVIMVCLYSFLNNFIFFVFIVQ
jgi:calcium-independent phospholipase A2